ncbi:hypothetical protein BGW36DRAFT_399699 [Talaromyces proteolyticus]|uniref:Uncharacterized protein n=1 Tax=Talaromyces proteolyticus TaxID=1131652 RepID=A0AAD4KJU3_9EURO|nr:uncharacterized protein BGW36DRAFT_399699 [Talaromyces proteolyticus]KAH8692906.1 hypothetical protein BGW36DRAFT_399699 [Talaromyces proteolyticus]
MESTLLGQLLLLMSRSMFLCSHVIVAFMNEFQPDRWNPYNWPMWKRVYHPVLPAVFSLVVTIGSSIYTSAVPEVINRFDVSDSASIVPSSLFPRQRGLWSDARSALERELWQGLELHDFPPDTCTIHTRGRLRTKLRYPCDLSFLAGIFASPPLVVSAGTNADIWKPEHRALATTLFALYPFFGPALRSGTPWIILFFAMFAYILVLGIQETYKKIIIFPSGWQAMRFRFKVTFLRPVKMLYSKPIVIAWSLYIGFTFAVLYSFFTAFQYIDVTVYEFNIQQIGLTFIPTIVGSFLGSVNVVLVNRRLHVYMIGGCGLPIGLFYSLIAAVISGLLYLLDVYGVLEHTCTPNF